MQNNNVQYAGFLVRFVAYMVDCVIVGIAILMMNIPRGIFSLIFPNSFLDFKVLFTFTVWDVIMYILTVLYFIGFTYFFSATVGKKVMKLKVVSAEGEKLGIWSTVYRETIGRYLSSLLCGLGYVYIAFDPQKRGIQDLLADTRVVYDVIVRHENVFENNTQAQTGDFVVNQTPTPEPDVTQPPETNSLPYDDVTRI